MSKEWGTPDFEKFSDYFQYLKLRWEDESQYESFADYKEATKKNLPERFTFVNMTKNPFQVTFKEKTTEVKRTLLIAKGKVTLFRHTEK